MNKRLRAGFWMWATSLVLFCAVVISCGEPKAAEPSLNAPVFVVATDQLNGKPYAGAVMLAVPIYGGHVGLVLNMPTEAEMGLVFHNHPPSKAIKDPIYRGGFEYQDTVFAMVRAEKSPTSKALAMLPGVWLVMRADEIDQVIEKMPNAARYYAGMVTWTPGLLESEVSRGVVALRPLDPAKLFLKDTSGLYRELAPRSKNLKDAGGPARPTLALYPASA